MRTSACYAHRFAIAGLLGIGLLISWAAQADGGDSLSAPSQPPGLIVTLQSQLQPLTINQMHSWVITLLNEDGTPLEDARIEVDGGMPAHDHGLATQPQVTGYLGAGRYLLEGMRFHMNGEWTLQLRIHHNRSYTAAFTLQL